MRNVCRLATDAIALAYKTAAVPSNSFLSVIPSCAYESSPAIIANNLGHEQRQRGLPGAARIPDEPRLKHVHVDSIEHNDGAWGHPPNPSAASVMLVTARASLDAYA